MSRYIAIPSVQFSDQTAIKPIEIKAENMTEARHKIINHFDCSYSWTIKELS